MKRSWIWIVLLLSLGVNAGILATLLAQRWRQPAPQPGPQAPALQPAAPDAVSSEPVAPEPAPVQPAVPEAAAPGASAARPPRTTVPRPSPPPAPGPEPLAPAAESAPEPAPAATEAASPEPREPESTTESQPPAGLDSGGAPPRSPKFEILADRLGLEGESRERFVAIQRQAFEAMRLQRQRMITARSALRLELIAPSPNRARLQALVAESTAAQQELEKILVNSLVESRALLDAKQQRLYMRFVEERLRPGSQLPPRRPLRDRLLNRRGLRP
jgi:Spy/CpxP family protein refolding chaperone